MYYTVEKHFYVQLCTMVVMKRYLGRRNGEPLHVFNKWISWTFTCFLRVHASSTFVYLLNTYIHLAFPLSYCLPFSSFLVQAPIPHPLLQIPHSHTCIIPQEIVSSSQHILEVWLEALKESWACSVKCLSHWIPLIRRNFTKNKIV